MTWILWLLSLQSVALGHLYGGLALALGFARHPYYDDGALICWWRTRFHWASWLGLSLVIAGVLVALGITGHWWYFGGAAAASIGIVLFLVFIPGGYTTTIGHCMILSRYAGTRTIFHEKIHIRQYEDRCLLAGALSGALFPFLGWKVALALWATGGAPWLAPNFVASAMRYWRPGVRFMDAVYYDHTKHTGAEHECSAYAQTAQFYT